MKKELLPILFLGITTAASAQIFFAEEQPLSTMNSVTNEGIGVGYNDKRQPFYLWNPYKDTFKEIGGISPGDGVGGCARFDDSGKFISAPLECDAIPVNLAWTETNFPEMAPYRINQIIRTNDYNIWLVGSTPDDKQGCVFWSVTNGVNWKRADSLSIPTENGKSEVITPNFGIKCFEFFTYFNTLAGGTDGQLIKDKGTGGWMPADPLVPNKEVKTYYAMNFRHEVEKHGWLQATSGCVGVELKDGTGAIFFTPDGDEKNFDVATGVVGIPVSIGHTNTEYYYVTEEGSIYGSPDNGKTWSFVYKTPNGEKLHRIVFDDADNGVAVSDGKIFISTDGGTEWTAVSTVDSKWYDAAWYNGMLTIVGDKGAYQTSDLGKTFTKVNEVNDMATAIGFTTSGACNIGGISGNMFRKEYKDAFEGVTAAIYDVENDTWTPCASTGNQLDGVTSAPWCFSGDGKHVAGLSWGFNPKVGLTVGYAAVWNGTEEVTLLPNKFEKKGKPCRANGISYDGSVIVGYQDVFGPWFGSIWRKGADGQYTQKLMTAGELSEDEIDYKNWDQCYANLAGQAQCVSDNGKWIGGMGQSDIYALPGAWIWSEETGYIKITEEKGTTICVNNDGTMALGWEGLSANAWIWTKDGGRQDLQSYVTNTLGYNTGEYVVGGPYDISPNGRYVTGFALKGLDAHGYILDLLWNVGVEERMAEQVKAAVYPNPVAEELHVDLPFDYTEVASTVSLYNLQGQRVAYIDRPNQSNVIDVRSLSKGIYVLSVKSAKADRTFKVIVK